MAFLSNRRRQFAAVATKRVPTRRRHAISSWQIADDGLIDGLMEDGTDFLPHAAGASPVIPEHDRGGMVVAGHAGVAGARADRSGGEA